MNSERVLKKLSFAVGVFAMAVAGLVGIGQQSLDLPLLVGGCVIASWIYTDWLKWVQLPRWLVYIMMILGSLWAIMDYFSKSSFQQLFAVANLLIYAQLPLLFQKKSRRIFEQMGIFLLLELVVAALVNEDFVYGLALMPVLALGAWVMMLFAQYISAERGGIRAIDTNSIWKKIAIWLGLRPAIELERKISMKVLDDESTNNVGVPWWQLGLPTTLAIAGIAIVYFGVAPRLSLGSYSTEGFASPIVGLNDRVRLDQVGPISQNPRPILKVELHNSRNNEDYTLIDPPYLRGRTLTEYVMGERASEWLPGDYSRIRYTNLSKELFKLDANSSAFATDLDLVEARITELQLLETPIVLAPFFLSESFGDISRFQFDRDNWNLLDVQADAIITPEIRRKYSFYTLAFQRGKQTRFVPESEELVEESNYRSRAAKPYQQFAVDQLAKLREFRKDYFPGLLALRERIIASANIDPNDPLDRALELENYLATNPEFSYTLNLTMPRDRSLDATEDFIVNQKRGHCQYFASALALMLRSEGIPTRLVNGLRPIEYNELGNYLLVRQSHAHTWVEAYFTKEQFTNSRSMPFPSNYKDGAWVRFDPTPAGVGSNSRRPLSKPPGATWDFAQQLWKDYVIQVDRSDRSTLLEGFGALTGEGYQNYFERFQAMSNSGRLPVIGWFLPRGDGGWLQWLRLILLLAALWLLWRNRALLFRLTLPGFTRRRKRQQRQIAFDFYKRCVQSLEKLGWQRRDDMTHREFATQTAQDAKRRYQLEGAGFPLDSLTQAYCDLRYGPSEALDPSRVQQLDELASRFEATLQQLPQNANSAPQNGKSE